MSSIPERLRQFAASPALWCALAVGVCVIASHPYLEMGFDDDFSYIYTAKVLASSGHVVYNNWATAMLGWQLYLGALFIKIFGFSFTVVRFSVLLVAMATSALMQRAFVRLGINERNATLATLTLTTSPLYLPLAFSFMTDIPGFFAIMLCIYGCLRAVGAPTDRSAMYWIAFAAVTNAVGGTARQIAWLGVLVLVPSTAWVLRRRRGIVVASGLLWIVSAGFIAACMSWFKRQPNSVNEPMAVHFHFFSHKYLAIPLFFLPILTGYLASFNLRARWARIQAALGIAVVVIPLASYAAFKNTSFREHIKLFLAPFSDVEVTAKGLDVGAFPGTRPDVIPIWIQILLTVITLLAFIAFLITLLNSRRLQAVPGSTDESKISARALTQLLGPFTLAYLLLMITRAAVFERYFLPLLFSLMVFALRFFQAKVAARLPFISAVPVVLFAAFAVLTLHDALAASRASLSAADHLIAAGVPRDEIRAGFAYDGWTQIDMVGRLAPKKRIANPPPCARWWESDTPAIHGLYELSYDDKCSPKSKYPAVEYGTWLPPYHQKIYTLRINR